MSKVPYLNAVGALMYLATSTRPDIAYSVGVLARYNSNPGIAHWKAVKHVFRYLKGSMDYKLVYSGSGPSRELFVTYTDADHGGNKDNGKSTGGYLVCVGNGAISWSSKLQPVVSISTTEAEYYAAVEAGKEILWLRNLLGELGYSFPTASTLLIDNQSTVTVTKNPEHFGRMKHMDLRYFWLRDEVETGNIIPKFVPTGDNPADLLTKPLPRLKVASFRRMMGIEIA